MTPHFPTKLARRLALTFGLAALAALPLAGCGVASSPTPVASPTPEAAATLLAATVPTIEPSPTAAAATSTDTAEPTATAAPTGTATTAPAEPTATTAPTQAPETGPAVSISPRSGGPGTAVHLVGSHFPPGKMVTIRIGLPNPIGEALGSAKVAADGTWEATVKIPGTLPSGQPITTTNMQLIPMDENNQPYATQPFSFAPSGAAPGGTAGGSTMSPQDSQAYPSSPDAVVTSFLNVFSADANSPDLQRYLSFFRKTSASPMSIAGLMNVDGKIDSFSISSSKVNDAGDNAAVVVKLSTGGTEQTRNFTLVNEKGEWHVDNVDTPR